MTGLGPRTLDWVGDAVLMVDQTALPERYTTLRVESVPALVAAIRRLAVRGAPAIGVAGAFGVALAVRRHGSDGPDFEAALAALRGARPTAVNLARMVDRAAAVAGEGFDRVLQEAIAVRDEEIAASVSLAEAGVGLAAELLGGGSARVMTVCNTGALAAVERGTALAVIEAMHERGLLKEAIVLETRPLLQGARLTTWELQRMGAPHRLIVDAAAPFLLAQGQADIVMTGADRIAANGDVANKVGTFSLALGADHAGVPFVVVAPESSVDLGTPAGRDIEVEQRGAAEVTSISGVRTAPDGTDVLNPAFDVTPAELITAVVTDRRVIRLDRAEGPLTVPLGAPRSPEAP